MNYLPEFCEVYLNGLIEPKNVGVTNWAPEGYYSNLGNHLVLQHLEPIAGSLIPKYHTTRIVYLKSRQSWVSLGNTDEYRHLDGRTALLEYIDSLAFRLREIEIKLLLQNS
jgi:hypothetical protein